MYRKIQRHVFLIFPICLITHVECVSYESLVNSRTTWARVLQCSRIKRTLLFAYIIRSWTLCQTEFNECCTEFNRKIVVTCVLSILIAWSLDLVNRFCRKFKISGADNGSIDVYAICTYTFRENPIWSKIIFWSYFPILETADSDRVSGGLSVKHKVSSFCRCPFFITIKRQVCRRITTCLLNVIFWSNVMRLPNHNILVCKKKKKNDDACCEFFSEYVLNSYLKSTYNFDRYCVCVFFFQPPSRRIVYLCVCVYYKYILLSNSILQW